jgi:hypothetical protein
LKRLGFLAVSIENTRDAKGKQRVFRVETFRAAIVFQRC